jgi:hypothetical protein
MSFRSISAGALRSRINLARLAVELISTRLYESFLDKAQRAGPGIEDVEVKEKPLVKEWKIRMHSELNRLYSLTCDRSDDMVFLSDDDTQFLLDIEENPLYEEAIGNSAPSVA